MRLLKTKFERMKRFAFISYIFLCIFFINREPSICVAADSYDGYSLIKHYILPSQLEETSGLIYYRGLVWTFNDSGGEPQIYAYSEKDSVVKQVITITNGQNVDWEEITQDSSFIYAGDIGNNLGMRDSLCIYRIAKSQIPKHKLKVKTIADSILFTYPNYQPVTLPLKNSRYDCEAMLWHNDSIYLFSKDWETQHCSIYVLPARPGKYTARLIGSFNARCLITAASYNGKTLYLLGYSNYKAILWRFDDVSNFRLKEENGHREMLHFLQNRQCEGVAIKDSTTLYISSEKTQIPQSLYLIRVN
jgi:hypothetical protein